jgi:UDP-2-acetamido-3-amino-2,3-dideoxy-glucuronate N-acetyltransferase
MMDRPFYMHPSAEVSLDAHIGVGTRIWNQVHMREHASIGEACNFGKGVGSGSLDEVGGRRGTVIPSDLPEISSDGF